MSLHDALHVSRERPLRQHEIDALHFASHGPHCIGMIDSDEKFAAAIVFQMLTERGLLIATIEGDGPHYRITPKGRAALKEK